MGYYIALYIWTPDVQEYKYTKFHENLEWLGLVSCWFDMK